MGTESVEPALAARVAESFRDAPDERLRTVLASLVTHLHAFVGDVRPTPAEWESAIGFLTATGHACTDTRQEFILLSDVLGVPTLVEALNTRADCPTPFRQVEFDIVLSGVSPGT
jgi:hydroxyquinol 1,2-dioxygenase